MNGLIIIIGKIGLVLLINRKTVGRDVNKRISRPFVLKIALMVFL